MPDKQPNRRGRGLPRFAGGRQLAAWLKGTTEGNRILAEATRDHISGREWLESTPEGQALAAEIIARASPIAPRPAVVVVLSADGHVEAWGDREEVAVKIVHGPAITSPTYAADREEIIESLPLYHKDAMRRGKLLTNAILDTEPRRGAVLMRVAQALQWMRSAAKPWPDLPPRPTREEGARPDEAQPAQTQDVTQSQEPAQAEAAEAESREVPAGW